MDRNHVLFHLKEASEELLRTIADIEAHPEYPRGEFALSMQHLYHHLNTAWNTRSLGPKQIEVASDRDLNNWGLFPMDLPMMETTSTSQ